jgi:hypothetical protein
LLASDRSEKGAGWTVQMENCGRCAATVRAVAICPG